jgi:hypothetical protein
MFKTVYENIKSFFSIKDIIEDENEWIENKLQIWKLDLYSNNVFLIKIPMSRIIEKKQELKKEYDLKFKNK